MFDYYGGGKKKHKESCSYPASPVLSKPRVTFLRCRIASGGVKVDGRAMAGGERARRRLRNLYKWDWRSPIQFLFPLQLCPLPREDDPYMVRSIRTHAARVARRRLCDEVESYKKTTSDSGGCCIKISRSGNSAILREETPLNVSCGNSSNTSNWS